MARTNRINISTSTSTAAGQPNNDVSNSLSIISYNMHGFNQGSHAITDLIDKFHPDIFLLQEHWLTPANLNHFQIKFPSYIAIGKSAMDKAVESGPLIGRPYGGVCTLIKSELANCITILNVSEKYVLIKLCNSIVLNLYLPCVGSSDRLSIIDDILLEVEVYLENSTADNIIVGGDMNMDLNASNLAVTLLTNFMNRNGLKRCDELCNKMNEFTYINHSLGHYSCIDYLFVTDETRLLCYDVIEPEVNLSDHLPIIINYTFNIPVMHQSSGVTNDCQRTVTQLRWDQADLLLYYNLTGMHLQNVLRELDECLSDVAKNDVDVINIFYDKMVSVLQHCANAAVPERRKNFYKFWWSQELDCLKEEAVKSHSIWKAAGKPRSGFCFDKYRSDKLAYKLAIREHQQQEKSAYSNDLHEALINKQGQNFWNCWRSKFETNRQRPRQIDGLVDDNEIAEKFAQHFKETCSPLSDDGNKKLKDLYEAKRVTYTGSYMNDELLFDAALVDKIVTNMKRGKAAGLDGLTAEHIQYCHPCLPTLLSKLFNCMMQQGKVPQSFGMSYTIPLLKGNLISTSKSLLVTDFRGISISPVISKVFENCILSRYSRFLSTSHNQFGFKKSLSCSHVIYSVRQAVDHFTKSGSTVNLCALDMCKAFDKMSHYGCYIKLMDRLIPNCLLNVLEHWFNICVTCVRWGSSVSQFVALICGVRQGGVLSPHLFAVYIDDIINKVAHSNDSSKINFICVSIFVYADDILLLSPSITLLQRLVSLVEGELIILDMAINPCKSVCLRIGKRFNVACANIVLINGSTISWSTNCRYLGVYIMSFRVFKCSSDNAKKAMFRSFNAIYGKVGHCASEEVIFHLFNSKCLPALMYGLDACPVNNTERKSLDFSVFRIMAKVLGTTSNNIITECRTAFGLEPLLTKIDKIKLKFLQRFSASENLVCTTFGKCAISEISIIRNK